MKLQEMLVADNVAEPNTIYVLPQGLREEIEDAVVTIAALKMRGLVMQAKKVEDDIAALIRKRAKECAIIKNVGI